MTSVKPLLPVRPRDDQSPDPPRREGGEQGQDEENTWVEDYTPTSPASGIARDAQMNADEGNADDYGYADDGMGDDVPDPDNTPVADHGESTPPAQLPKSEQDGSFICPPCDGRTPITLRSPIKPSKEDVEKHCALHLPYRNWCPVCVKSKGREDAHARSSEDENPGLPVISMDYNELDDKTESRSNKTLIIKDEESGAVLQYKVKCKGPKDEWVIKKLVRDIEELGRTDIRLKTDGEPSIVALQSKVIENRKARTLPINPPAYNPQANGSCEKAARDVTEQTRALKLGLEARLGVEISDDDKIMEWIYIHAPFLLTRYSVGHDGMVPWERLTGNKWHRPAVEIGEVVLAKLATRRTGKILSRHKKKLLARSVRAVCVGQVSRTGEHIVIVPSGDAVRCRTIFRVPEDERWNKDLIFAIQGTPRTPAPSRKDPERLEAQLLDDNDKEAKPREQREPRQGGEAREHSGAALQQPEVRGPRDFEPRRFRINNRLIQKYGYSDDCKGCTAKHNGLPSDVAGDRTHSQACRQRFTNLMMTDQNDKDIIAKDANKFADVAKESMNCEAQPAQLPKMTRRTTWTRCLRTMRT